MALPLPGCGGAPDDVRQAIATFYEAANAGRLADAGHDFGPAQSQRAIWDDNIARRASLGRMIRTSQATVESFSANVRFVIVRHNTAFERGHGVEAFYFRIDDGGTRMETYTFAKDKKVWCPAITISPKQCSIEDVPVTATSSR
jgi:hypothetical protein